MNQMLEVLLTILAVFLIFRLVSTWMVRHFLRKQARRMDQAPFGEKPPTTRNKKKIMKKDVGEYVDFEEIKQNNPPD